MLDTDNVVVTCDLLSCIIVWFVAVVLLQRSAPFTRIISRALGRLLIFQLIKSIFERLKVEDGHINCSTSYVLTFLFCVIGILSDNA